VSLIGPIEEILELLWVRYTLLVIGLNIV
jgi:hypothetical protein